MFPAYYTGFADEAGAEIETQIRVTQELGWSAIEMRNVKVPGYDAANLHDIPDAAFELVVAQLSEAGVRVNSLGSTLGNWASDLSKPFEIERAAACRAAERATRLKADFIRVMSYPIGDVSDLREEERFRRLREIVAMFSDTACTVVHENCGNYGGMGSSYALRLMENVPGLKMVFDMGNTVKDRDYDQPSPHPFQSGWDFYQQVKTFVPYIHIKDARWDENAEKTIHTFPGEGTGDVRRIIEDLFLANYQGGLSIEPHMQAGLAAPELTTEENCQQTYVEYGRRLMRMVEEISATVRPFSNP